MEGQLVKIVKLVDTKNKYKDKSGKEHSSVNYYIVFNNTWIAFRPSFAKGYTQCDTICEQIVNK